MPCETDEQQIKTNIWYFELKVWIVNIIYLNDGKIQYTEDIFELQFHTRGHY